MLTSVAAPSISVDILLQAVFSRLFAKFWSLLREQYNDGIKRVGLAQKQPS